MKITKDNKPWKPTKPLTLIGTEQIIVSLKHTKIVKRTKDYIVFEVDSKN